MDEITSIQIEGISMKDMEQLNLNTNMTLKKLLLNISGVCAVERTFYTERRGQWIVVIKKGSIVQFKEFINKNLSVIYSAKRDGKMRLVTYQVTNSIKAYKLQMIRKYSNSVGSYAEALMKRFGKEDSDKGTRSETSNDMQPLSNGDENILVDENLQNMEFPPLSSPKVQTSTNDPKISTTNPTTAEILQQPGDNKNTQTKIGVLQQTDREESRTNINPPSTTKPSTDEMQQHVQMLRDENTRNIDALATSLENKFDEIIERKMEEITSTLADAIAAQVALTMKKLFSHTRKVFKPQEVTPLKQMSVDNENTEIQPMDCPMTPTKENPLNDNGNSTTLKMIQELQNIKNHDTFSSPPTHDTQIKGEEMVQ